MGTAVVPTIIHLLNELKNYTIAHIDRTKE